MPTFPCNCTTCRAARTENAEVTPTATTYSPVDGTMLLPNTFGVELEFSASNMGYRNDSPSGVADLLQRAVATRNLMGSFNPIRVSTSMRSTGSAWEAKYDGSCGLEVASPALTWLTWPEVVVVTEAIRDHRGRITRSCGLHVHHHFPNLDNRQLRRIWLLWAAFEDVIFGMLPASRRRNEYCRSLLGLSGNRRWAGLRNLVTPVSRFQQAVEGGDRYRTLNMTHWWRTGRLEVRVHHGTLDAEEIRNWTLLTQEFIHVGTSYVDPREIGRWAAVRGTEKIALFTNLVTRRSSHPHVAALAGYVEEAIHRQGRYLTAPEVEIHEDDLEYESDEDLSPWYVSN